MYQFSRGIYRELAPLVERRNGGRADLDDQLRVLDACESAIHRLASDRQYFAKPARTLFSDVRSFFPVARQHHVYRVIEHYVTLADEFLAALPAGGCDADGNPIQCRAMTRKGTTCQRTPLARNGYCPSHQHLAETEHEEAPALAA
ncbi:MAG TPA: hypothetical protein VHM72_05700 [Solirubrobacteraceae bacterium]|jgi:hypothetical protein|nr:hypothetical protein [Solirubrobacteraceae bacterium]